MKNEWFWLPVKLCHLSVSILLASLWKNELNKGPEGNLLRFRLQLLLLCNSAKNIGHKSFMHSLLGCCKGDTMCVLRYSTPLKNFVNTQVLNVIMCVVTASNGAKIACLRGGRAGFIRLIDDFWAVGGILTKHRWWRWCLLERPWNSLEGAHHIITKTKIWYRKTT